MMVAAFTLLSWLGGYIHNFIELPQLTLLSLENSLTALVAAMLFLGWWLLPYKRIAAGLFLAWALLHFIVGAVITVIPFSFLPFYPEQTLIHYVAHLVYGLTQLPLILAMISQLTQNSLN